MSHKNNYSAVVFFSSVSPKKWTFVHFISKFQKYLNQNHGGWKYANIYSRKTGKFITRINPFGNYSGFID